MFLRGITHNDMHDRIQPLSYTNVEIETYQITDIGKTLIDLEWKEKFFVYYSRGFDWGIILLVYTFVDTLISKFGTLNHLADENSKQI
mgnify:CR=1 FL=1